MSDSPHPAVECRSHRRLLFHLHRGELDAARAAEVRTHLDACAACRRFDEVESGFDRAIVRGLGRATLTDAARERLLSGLDAADAEPPPTTAASPSRSGLWGPLLRAAALVVLGMLIPLLGGRMLRPGGDGIPGPSATLAGEEFALPGIDVELAGTLVDDICDRAGVPVEVQQQCRKSGHHTALRTDRGEYLALVGARRARLSLDPASRGLRVLVEGLYDSGAGTLAVLAVQNL